MAGKESHLNSADNKRKAAEGRKRYWDEFRAKKSAQSGKASDIPAQSVEELEDRAKEALQPQEAKGQKLELAKTFSQFLVLGTVLGAYGLQQPALAMTDAEAGALALPLANMFARTGLNRQIGRYLVGSNDYVAIIWALFQYGQRVAEGWVSNDQKVHVLRHSPEAFHAGVPAAEPASARGSAASNGHSPSDGITIARNIIGGGWRANA